MIRSRILATCLVAVLAGGFFVLRHRSEPAASTDNRQASSVAGKSMTPTLVGRHVCRECHEENYRLHQHSGHASTFATTRDSDLAKVFVGKTLDAGENYGQFAYGMAGDGLRVRRLSDSTQASFPLQYALGSGRNAVTLFTLIPDGEQRTAGIEHRVSWFRSHGEFGLTPGQVHNSPESEVDFFGDTVRGQKMHQCVRCHTTSGTIVGQEISGLIANVNCEKCHGAGSEHVRQARLSQTPPPFSVGHENWDLESELQLCGNCHRLPRHVSVRELREYPSEMLRFQPIGLLRSECYLESEGRLMCSTCHNPHMDSATKSNDSYVQDCRNCHLADSDMHVACPVSPTEGCIECHMPAITFEQGMVFHDHWIRVRDNE